MFYDKKIVEVKGIGFPNRGAELLLYATLEQLKKRGYLACTEPYSSFEYKLRHPLLTKLKIYRYGVNLLAPLQMMPKYIRERLGFISSKEVDFILDASGYAYGDPWPKELAANRVLNELKSKPTVFLPQSFGPFRYAHSRKVISEIVEKTDLLYARESIGADFIKDVTGKSVKIVPDITFDLKTEKSSMDFDVLVIPNFQVLKREGDKYIYLLCEIIQKLLLKSRVVTLLNHEGEQDLVICERLKASINSVALNIVSPSDGLDAKAMIANSNFVISSRYHGLISALSQSIPCYPIGWSFKYWEAMKLFGIEVGDSIPSADLIVEKMYETDYIGIFSSEDYKDALTQIQKRISDMWEEVFDTVSQ